MTSRSMVRVASLSFAAAVLGATLAQAAVIGTATLVRDPANGINFTNPGSALGAPWVGYTLGLSTNDGQLIGGVDVSISGQLHQRWAYDEDSGEFVATGNSQNATNADSHLRAVTGALFGAGPTEDNPGTGSPLPSTSADLFGVGTKLSGAWGITNATSTANLAYIVIPRGSQISTDIKVSVANPAGDIIGNLTAANFEGFLPNVNTPPTINPLVQNVTWPNSVSSLQLSASDAETAAGSLTWSNLVYSGPGAGNGSNATLSSSGVFSWDPTGYKNGAHTFTATVSDGTASTTGLALTVNYTVPEPATMTMIGLALVGCVGIARRRS